MALTPKIKIDSKVDSGEPEYDLTPYDPAASLGDDDAVEAFLRDAEETRNSGYIAAAQTIAKRALTRKRCRSTISKRQQAERFAAIRNALADQRIEGREPETQAVNDAVRGARNETTIETAADSVKARIQQKLNEEDRGAA